MTHRLATEVFKLKAYKITKEMKISEKWTAVRLNLIEQSEEFSQLSIEPNALQTQFKILLSEVNARELMKRNEKPQNYSIQ